jgi:hypothetical protein
MSIIYPLLRFELVSRFCLSETIIFCDNDLHCAHEYSGPNPSVIDVDDLSLASL